jgi:hypothetical protein
MVMDAGAYAELVDFTRQYRRAERRCNTCGARLDYDANCPNCDYGGGSSGWLGE